MKAMLIWSDGTEISTHIFEDKDGKTGYERAVEAMHKEYDDHNWKDSAKEEFGAFRGDSSCCYSAEDEDMCFWQVEELPEEKFPVIPNILSQDDRCELFGCLIDAVEDFLEEKGVTPDMIPNDEREEEEDNNVLIYGSDYDDLADRFSAILGVERDMPEGMNKEQLLIKALKESNIPVMVNSRWITENECIPSEISEIQIGNTNGKQSLLITPQIVELPDKYSDMTAEEIADELSDDVLEAAYRKRELQYRIQDAKNHAEELGYEISDEDAESIARRFLVIQDCNVAENDLFDEIIDVYINKGKIWNDNGEIPLPESLFDTPDFDNER